MESGVSQGQQKSFFDELPLVPYLIQPSRFNTMKQSERSYEYLKAGIGVAGVLVLLGAFTRRVRGVHGFAYVGVGASVGYLHTRYAEDVLQEGMALESVGKLEEEMKKFNRK